MITEATTGFRGQDGRRGTKVIRDSPVEQVRKKLPRGDGQWPGYSTVYQKISAACDRMGRMPYVCLSDEHVDAMAVLGCGHEETMKAMLHHLRYRGFVS
jgi:hypothetical protein